MCLFMLEEKDCLVMQLAVHRSSLAERRNLQLSTTVQSYRNITSAMGSAYPALVRINQQRLSVQHPDICTQVHACTILKSASYHVRVTIFSVVDFVPVREGWYMHLASCDLDWISLLTICLDKIRVCKLHEPFGSCGSAGNPVRHLSMLL